MSVKKNLVGRPIEHKQGYVRTTITIPVELYNSKIVMELMKKKKLSKTIIKLLKKLTTD